MHVVLHSRCFTLTHCRSCLCKALAITGGTHSPARHSHMANDTWQNTYIFLSSVRIPAVIQCEISPSELHSKMLHNFYVEFCPVDCKHSTFYFITDTLKFTTISHKFQFPALHSLAFACTQCYVWLWFRCMHNNLVLSLPAFAHLWASSTPWVCSYNSVLHICLYFLF